MSVPDGDLAQRHNETASEGDESNRFSRLNGLIGFLVSAIASILLLLLGLATFVDAIWRLLSNLGSEGQLIRAIDAAVNDALLLLIIGELLITVTQKANLVRELLEFLVIGVTTLVRHALSLVLKEETSGNVIGDLALNSLAVLILIVAFLAVRIVEARLYPPAADPPVRKEVIE